MNIPRDNSLERRSEQERLQVRSGLVEASCLEAEAALYTEFAAHWGAAALKDQTATAGNIVSPQQTRAFTGAADAISFTAAEDQRQEAAYNQQVRAAQQGVEEAFGEFTA